MATKRQGVRCYDNAGMDEPIFVLRAHDRAAPGTVRDWARRVVALGGETDKTREAMDLALEMEAWQAANGCKTPD